MSRQTFITATATLIIGLTAGYFLFSSEGHQAPAVKKSGGKEVAYWVAPMDPKYRRDKPGKSPMGMDLIPVYKGEELGEGDVGFTVSPNVLSNLGVRTSTAEMTDFSARIKTSGKVDYDETRLSRIQLRTEGWVEKLNIRAAGEKVQKGDLLFSFYAPEIASAISDYFQAAKLSAALRKSAYARLKSYGVSDKSLKEVFESNNAHSPINVYADRSGIVSHLGIRDGGRIAKNTVAFDITDPSIMWIIADVYLHQAENIQIGQIAAINGTDTATVNYIYPDADAKLQSVRVRLKVQNHQGRFKAGQYVSVEIEPDSTQSLTVPDAAIIRLGTMNRVILSHGEGKFEAAEVEIGASAQGRTVITTGLTAGEKIVTSGQFMLDSESSFSAASIRMAKPKAKAIESEVFAMGTINSVDIKAGKVNITHPEIPEIGWPTMTMDMDVVNGIDLSKIKAGSKVHFGLGKNTDGMYVITVIHVMNGKMGTMQ